MQEIKLGKMERANNKHTKVNRQRQPEEENDEVVNDFIYMSQKEWEEVQTCLIQPLLHKVSTSSIQLPHCFICRQASTTIYALRRDISFPEN